MIIKYTQLEEDINHISKLWNKHINYVENRYMSLALYIFGIILVWLFEGDSFYRYLFTVFLLVMIVFLYFRSYHYKQNIQCQSFLFNTEEKTIKIDKSTYKVKKLYLQDEYALIFYKNLFVAINLDKIPSIKKNEILSLFKDRKYE